MLELKNIKKTYQMGENKVEALKGISIEFRKSEFVSILGPSGCGKTTLLNIVGGLDRYDKGDLVINGKSTKEFKDKDWDNYRNHSVGFVFQSYNLIPHQTVLENVELALTLSGVSKEERRKRATEVLTKVGLKDKLKSRPNQLSGGQMQRVAIARALVNDPEIILADEPTGALDTESSVQVMELLKTISKDKLIIMVTHNPELAHNYSSRIIRLLDGNLIDDSLPFVKAEDPKEKKLLSVENDENLSKREQNKKNKKRRMSFWMALTLSFKNLLTKKGRTILVSFAGSIGIIGIALVLAISSGFNTYITKMQEDTLSNYPIEVQAKKVDLTSILTSMIADRNQSGASTHEKDAVYLRENITKMMNSVGVNLGTNNLDKFYEYIKQHKDELMQYCNAIQLTYSMNVEFYSKTLNLMGLNDNVQPNSQAIMKMIIMYSLDYFADKTKLDITNLNNGSYRISKNENSDPTFILSFGDDLRFIYDKVFDTSYAEYEGYIDLDTQKVLKLVFTIMNLGNPEDFSMGGTASLFKKSNLIYEMIDNETLIKSQYDLIGTNSRFPVNADEAVLVLDKNSELDDYVLYTLGIIDDVEMDKVFKGIISEEKYVSKVNFDDIVGHYSYKVLDECDYFVDVENNGTYVDIRTLKESQPLVYIQKYKEALQNCTNEVKIVGILRLNETTDNGSLNTGIAYLNKFTDQMIAYHNAHPATIDTSVPELTTISKDHPASILLYVNSFDSKANVKQFIATYNKGVANEDQIDYTDYVDLIMSTVSTIINAITYVLIAFVSVSLIVSSIMIGIITYISVIERTKEIGVLRSVGASKRDVKRVFTAESFIIGLFSGLLGIVVSLILILPINIVLNSFTNIWGLASLPVLGSVILVLVSVGLTFIAGLIPAQSAAKKDPVIALRADG